MLNGIAEQPDPFKSHTPLVEYFSKIYMGLDFK